MPDFVQNLRLKTLDVRETFCSGHSRIYCVELNHNCGETKKRRPFLLVPATPRVLDCTERVAANAALPVLHSHASPQPPLNPLCTHPSPPQLGTKAPRLKRVTLPDARADGTLPPGDTNVDFEVEFSSDMKVNILGFAPT